MTYGVKELTVGARLSAASAHFLANSENIYLKDSQDALAEWLGGIDKSELRLPVTEVLSKYFRENSIASYIEKLRLGISTLEVREASRDLSFVLSELLDKQTCVIAR